MILGTCPKCSAKKLPVKNGQLVPHMSNVSKGKPCDWGIPSFTEEGTNIPFLNNAHLDFYQNMMAMLDVLEEI